MTEEIRQGDALARLREMPSGSVQCVITSPPYYGLRDYDTDVWTGGDPDCDHSTGRGSNVKQTKHPNADGYPASAPHRGGGGNVCVSCGARRVSPWTGGDPDCDHYESELRRGVNLRDSAHSTRGGAVKAAEVGWIQYREACGKCGARRAGQWTGGNADCDHSMATTRTVGNAPSDKSTLTTNNGAGPRPGDKYHADRRREVATECPCGARWTTGQVGLERTPEEYVNRLVEIFREIRRVLRDDGTVWLNLGDSYNGYMANQRGTSLSGRNQQARPVFESGYGRRTSEAKAKDLLGIPWMVAFALRADGWYLRSDVIWVKPNPMPESVTDRPTSAHEHVFLLTKSARYFYDAEAIREQSTGTGGVRFGVGRLDGPSFSGAPHEYESGVGGRNKRNVWEVATQPYAEAHFATFPTKLVEPCLLAGSSPKACGRCGAPWERVTETEYRVHENWFGDKQAARHSRGAAGTSYREPVSTQTIGWQATCAHRDDSGRSLVLDPFAGSGTVGVVARWHGRGFAGIELSAEYCAMARRRILREGHPGRRAEKIDAKPGQLAMDLG